MKSEIAVKALSALGEPTRLAIFRSLVVAGRQGLVVGRIAEQLKVAPATLSFHLKTLHHAGLIGSAREGTFVRYVANYEAMNGLLAYLTENCCGGQPEQCIPGACSPTACEAPRDAA